MRRVGSVIDANEGEMTVYGGVVFLLNGAALYLSFWSLHTLCISPTINSEFGRELRSTMSQVCRRRQIDLD